MTSSLHRDLEKGLPLEIDSLQGAALDMASQCDLDRPASVPSMLCYIRSNKVVKHKNTPHRNHVVRGCLPFDDVRYSANVARVSVNTGTICFLRETTPSALPDD